MLPGDVPLEMVWIPAGWYDMGRYPSEQGSLAAEDPQHRVSLAQGLWMGKYELTKTQWTVMMGTTPWSGQPYVSDDEDSPAQYVSWNQAQAFIKELNDYTGLEFRLPSEADWEYACRAGTTTRFYWADDLSEVLGDAYAWWTHNAWDINEQYPHIVGTKLPNAWGLFDMSGNVWELCEDDYHGNFGGAPMSGEAWIDSPRGSHRVTRGGGFSSDGDNCRSARRFSIRPPEVHSTVGFRLAR